MFHGFRVDDTVETPYRRAVKAFSPLTRELAWWVRDSHWPLGPFALEESPQGSGNISSNQSIQPASSRSGIRTRRTECTVARLRVGIIGPLSPDSFADNLVASFESLGTEVAYLGESVPALRSQYLNEGLQMAAKAVALETQLQNRLIRQATKVGPELIVSVQGGLLPRTVQALKRAGAVVVLWFPDHVGTIGRQLMFAAGYDHVFFKEQHLVDRSRQILDLPAHYLPEACNCTLASAHHHLECGSLFPSRRSGQHVSISHATPRAPSK